MQVYIYLFIVIKYIYLLFYGGYCGLRTVYSWEVAAMNSCTIAGLRCRHHWPRECFSMVYWG